MGTRKRLIGPFAQVLPMANLPEKGAIKEFDLEVARNLGLIVEGEKIIEIGDFETLANAGYLVEEIDLPAVLLPGLVDCHTHLAWAGTRSRDYTLRNSGSTYQAILEAGGGIFDTVLKTQNASREDLVASTISRANRHMNEGVTTIEVKTGYGLLPTQEIKILEAIREANQKTLADLIPTCLAAHVCPKELSIVEFLELIEVKLLPQLKAQNLTNRVDIFVEPSAFPVAAARPYLDHARKMGFSLTVHADQFTTGGSQLAVELGALSADHLEASTDKEISILARSETVAVALPGASLGLGMAFTPARKLLDAGASLAIASDWNPGSAPMGDLLAQAAILGAYEKLSSAEVFAGLTYRAAKALGLHDRGRIQAGQLADMIAFSTDDYREILYHQGKMKPAMVWKKGNRI